ncbi:hypothetical protein DL93DRAFT_2224424 [Clavulina sp. PMI_390]|nr:hypothetical protein DL93DRAFT_2224424 [Clavulina sp. PMI_390]
MARGRKIPVTASSSAPQTSHTPKATRTVIRKFHVLLKKETALLAKNDLVGLVEVREQLQKMGGLPAYQAMSNIGQGHDRGGGTEKVLLDWLPSHLPDTIGKGKGKAPVQMLEVGALRPDNYAKHQSWITNHPIDLHSRHPDIREQDFLLLDSEENRDRWDVISLSLVINFVPDATDRGRMLRLAQSFLKPDTGLLYLVVPAPCITNSRYLDRSRLNHILTAVGLRIVEERLKPTGKLAYFLCHREPGSRSRIGDTKKNGTAEQLPKELTSKVTLREGGSRNNFTILLPTHS